MSESGEKRALLKKQLRAIRKGQGVTATKLETIAPLVMQALGASNGVEGLERLQAATAALGTGRAAHALRVAYAFEPGGARLLTKRREDLSEECDGAHPDTIEAWENDGIDELLVRLRTRPELHLLALASVDAGRLEYFRTMGLPRPVWEPGVEYEVLYPDTNNVSTNRSLPAFIYKVPTGLSPETLTLAVAINSPPFPTWFCAVRADDPFGISTLTGPEGIAAPRELLEGEAALLSMRWGKPTNRLYYMLAWGYD